MTLDPTQPVRMMPAEKYTSPDVLAWEQRHLFAGGWTCLGRVDDLFPTPSVTQRAVMVGDIQCLVVRTEAEARDVRQHLPASRPRAAARRRHLASGAASSARTTHGTTTSAVG